MMCMGTDLVDVFYDISNVYMVYPSCRAFRVRVWVRITSLGLVLVYMVRFSRFRLITLVFHFAFLTLTGFIS
jgi:hypothetical protein